MKIKHLIPFILFFFIRINMFSQTLEEYVSQGNELFDDKKYVNAILKYTKALEIEPRYAEVLFNRGDAYYMLDKYENAIKDFNKAIQFGYKNANIYFRRGFSKSSLGNYKEAILDYNNSLNFEEREDTYISRGYVYELLEQHDKAFEDYKSALRINPNSAVALHNIANSYSRIGMYNEAIETFTKSIKIDADYLSYYNRGTAYDMNGQFEKAIKDFNFSIKLNPLHSDSYLNRGDSKEDLFQLDDALADFSLAIKYDSNNATAYSRKGMILYGKENYPEAIQYLTKSVLLDTALIDIQEELTTTQNLIIKSTGEYIFVFEMFPEQNQLENFDSTYFKT